MELRTPVQSHPPSWFNRAATGTDCIWERVFCMFSIAFLNKYILSPGYVLYTLLETGSRNTSPLLQPFKGSPLPSRSRPSENSIQSLWRSCPASIHPTLPLSVALEFNWFQICVESIYFYVVVCCPDWREICSSSATQKSAPLSEGTKYHDFMEISVVFSMVALLENSLWSPLEDIAQALSCRDSSSPLCLPAVHSPHLYLLCFQSLFSSPRCLAWPPRLGFGPIYGSLLGFTPSSGNFLWGAFQTVSFMST